MIKKMSAQIVNLDSWFGFDPFGWLNLPGANTEEGFLSLVRNLLVLVLFGLVIAWIVTLVLMALKIITSLGNPEKIGEGFTGLKNLFIGITLTFLFLIAVIFILNFFV